MSYLPPHVDVTATARSLRWPPGFRELTRALDLLIYMLDPWALMSVCQGRHTVCPLLMITLFLSKCFLLTASYSNLLPAGSW